MIYGATGVKCARAGRHEVRATRNAAGAQDGVQSECDALQYIETYTLLQRHAEAMERVGNQRCAMT